jgi:hypothetical protein
VGAGEGFAYLGPGDPVPYIPHDEPFSAHELVAWVERAVGSDGYILAPGAAPQKALGQARAMRDIQVEMEEPELAPGCAARGHLSH